MKDININASRLLNFIQEIALIGPTPNGGSNRQALSNEDKQARELFISWCEKIGAISQLDSMGNLFLQFPGKSKSKSPILMGSHLDTQPLGGKYDGVYGVLAALEVMHTLFDHNIVLEHPVNIVVWSNEEGSRFKPAMSGSGVFSGKLSQENIYSSLDLDGISYLEALKQSKQMGNIPCKAFPFHASLELHIEQGPILEAENKHIGIVSGVQGINWYEITIEGESTHAGPTPMTMRKDPIQHLHSLLSNIYSQMEKHGSDARVTVGRIVTNPSSPNTVPQNVTFTLDIRHPNQETLDLMSKEIEDLCHQPSALFNVILDPVWQSPAIKFSPLCINAIEKACTEENISTKHMVSGAGHDSAYLSYSGPTGMIFIPCKDGVSHNESEHVDDEFLITGANVLLRSLLNLTDIK